ncbi:MAG: hypothetical protein ACI8RZ_005358 [Myxococcota bacterium]|jgi:hypothetical protein
MSTQDTDNKPKADRKPEEALPAKGKADDEKPATPSTLDELPESARQQDMLRLKRAEEAKNARDTSTMEELTAPRKTIDMMRLKPAAEPEEASGASTMEGLTASTKPIGGRTRLKITRQEEPKPPPSALESLLRLTPQAAARTGAVSTPDQPTALGDPSTTAPRMALRAEEEEVANVARLEGLMTFSHPLAVGRVEVDEHGTSSLDGLLGIRGGPVDLGLSGKVSTKNSSMAGADFPAGGGPMRLRRQETSNRPVQSSDLSRLVGDQPLPRARLPHRTTAGVVPEPDGFTPISPQQVEIRCELAAHQRCPGRKAPVAVGERLHHRLEFRYNRFELLDVNQVLYECPGVADHDPFAGANPAFFATHAPLGNGMLAKLIVAIFRDGLPLNRVETMMSQLNAPIAGSVLREQLIEASDALEPIVAQLRAGQRKPETSPPIPILQAGPKRDTFGHLLVHASKQAIVAELCDGSPDVVGETGIGVRLRDTAKGKGRGARWGQLRQKFFYALVTDNDRARRALRLLDQLPAIPDPEVHKVALSRLKRWLNDTYADIEVPKNRLEHAVTFGVSMWELLVGDGPIQHRQTGAVAEWAFDLGSIPAEQTLRFHSVLETCALLDVSPWDYLMDLLTRLSGPDTVASEWTPAAWKKSHG